MKKHFAWLSLSFITLLLMFFECLSANSDHWKAEEYFQNSSSQKMAAADLMQYVEIKTSDRILDVGCGDGKITAEIATRIPQGTIVGVDISPAMIEFAKSTFSNDFSNLFFSLKDAQDLDYNAEFDVVFSFTTQQWIQNHDAFLKGARKSLSPSGILAVTMPMGLPSTLEQAVNELVSTPQWSSYFHQFSTGWNFVDDKEYGALLAANQFSPVRLTVVPQRDIFPTREVFEKFIGQWFPYLRPLPEDLKMIFLNKVVDRFLEIESPFANGEVHFKIRRLEVVAVKG